ncbi:MAG: GNAT family N-acetyltransferase [Pseudomonadota bacterium]
MTKSSPPLGVAAAEHDAADALAALHAEAFPATSWDAPAIAKLMDAPGVFVLICGEKDRPTGFLMARLAADEMEILTLAVRPKLRRRGAGRALVAAACAAAKTGGASVWYLEVAADNAAACALYKTCGFEQAGTRPGYYASGADATLMARTI